MDQLEKELDYLNHALRNGTVQIEGCLKEIETILHEMAGAVRVYREGITQSHEDTKGES